MILEAILIVSLGFLGQLETTGLLSTEGTFIHGAEAEPPPEPPPDPPPPGDSFALISCEDTNPQYWAEAGYIEVGTTYSTTPFQLTAAQAVIGDDPETGFCAPWDDPTPWDRDETVN